MSDAIASREVAEAREHELLGPLACFADRHDARPRPEPADPFRTCFVRDRDRVIHCGAFRRLKDKTQVFVIDEGDYYRTRLTHTLEVSQVARSLCRALRLNEDLAEVLALVHDIGHPPFGHEGERMLRECAGVPFDHNRQALRIVDVLESPYPDRAGLNLTHAVRHSILKHGGRAGRGAPEWNGPVLEAQVADLSDSTAYQHHDLEDALRAGILVEDELAELPIWAEAAELIDAALFAGVEPRKRRKAILSRILSTSLADVIATSAAAIASAAATRAEDVAAARLRLVSYSPARAARHAELAAFLTERFYRHPRVLRSAATARDALAVIAEHYLEAPDELPETYRARIERDGLQRSVCDYVAGMTDRFAMDEWRRLSAHRPLDIVSTRAEMQTDERALAEHVETLEQRIGHVFSDRALAETALTHSSARSDDRHPNERLEFLGDSVLGMLVADDLFVRFPDHAEGELSRIKSSVVNRGALRAVAARWRLDELLNLGPGFRDPSDIPPSVVADAVEAVLGAVYLDGGLQAARRLVAVEFGPLVVSAADRSRGSNYKSQLQNFAQGSLGVTPSYEVLAEEGPDHEKTFSVAAVVGGERVAVASGRNKRQAEQRAAKAALAILQSAAPKPDAAAGATALRERAAEDGSPADASASGADGNGRAAPRRPAS